MVNRFANLTEAGPSATSRRLDGEQPDLTPTPGGHPGRPSCQMLAALAPHAPQLSRGSRQEAGHPERSDGKGEKHPDGLLNREAGALPWATLRCGNALRLQIGWG